MSYETNMTTTQEEYYPPPRTEAEVENMDLTFISDKWSADMLRDAMNAVVLSQLEPEMHTNEIDVWAYLSAYSPPVGEGFMFCRDKVIGRIQANMQISHSGSSLAFTMRHLELVAKLGFLKYRDSFKR